MSKLDFMLDKINTPTLPKWLSDLMIEKGVSPKKSLNNCKNCGNALYSDNIYGQCSPCYFKELNNHKI